MKYFMIMMLFMAGCSVYEAEWRCCEKVCASQGGVSWATPEADSSTCRCKNAVSVSFCKSANMPIMK